MCTSSASPMMFPSELYTLKTLKTSSLVCPEPCESYAKSVVSLRPATDFTQKGSTLRTRILRNRPDTCREERVEVVRSPKERKKDVLTNVFFLNFIFGTWTENLCVISFSRLFIEIPVFFFFEIFRSVHFLALCCMSFQSSCFLLFIPSIAKNKFLVLVLASGFLDKS